MNEQQLAAVKQALEALESFDGVGDVVTWEKQWKLCIKARESLLSIISQDALDKKAENARELGLSYDDAVKGGVGIMLGGKRIDPASIYAEPKIGCVNHDCDKCKAVQEPVAQDVQEKCRIETVPAKGGLLPTPPAPQPVPVKTYHDGKPWPVQPKPWVGLTDEEIKRGWKESWVDKQAFEAAVWWAEKKLKEKNL
jgi:hypothetical protein